MRSSQLEKSELTMRLASVRPFVSPKYAVATAALAGVIVGGAFVLPAAAQAPPPPIAAEPLTPRSVFVDDIGLTFKIKLDGHATSVVGVKDPSWTVVVRYTVQPGAQFPWHSHAGPVVVNIISGALTYVGADDCVQRTYAGGQAFVDAGQGHVHTAFNPTNAPTVFVATFFDAPAEGPLLIPAAPGGC
jgi:quercetin dioxygenase-like cupin family protein